MPSHSTNQMTNQHLVIMVKAPRLGQVKTRLAKDIGEVSATSFYRRTTNHIIHRLSNDPRWQTHIAIAPDTAIGLPFWPEKHPKGPKRSSQGQGNLGQRMHTQFKKIKSGPVLIIGTDIPQISASHIAKAFKELRNKSALLGPSGDGGYWIIGQKRTPKILQLFNNVRWSSEFTQNDTMANLKTSKWAITETLYDVDNGPEYKALNHHSRTLIPCPKG